MPEYGLQSGFHPILRTVDRTARIDSSRLPHRPSYNESTMSTQESQGIMQRPARTDKSRGANETPPRPSSYRMARALGPKAKGESDAAKVVPEAFGKVDRERLARLMEREGPGIVRMLWRMLGREADVMDAYQDCFCKLVTRPTGKKLRNEGAYAYRTATNIAIEILRSRKRRQEHWPRIVADRSNDCVSSDSVVDEPEHERFAALRETIAALPAHLRNVIVLRDLNGLSYEDVGKTLGIDPATARVYRRHAVVRLSEMLSKGSESCPS